MIYAHIGITVLWIFLFCYIIVASIDFGAGFFALHSNCLLYTSDAADEQCMV